VYVPTIGDLHSHRQTITQSQACKTSDSHSGFSEDSGFLGYDAMSLGEWLLMFQSYPTPPSTALLDDFSKFSKLAHTNWPQTLHHMQEKWSSMTQVYPPPPVQTLAMTPVPRKLFLSPFSLLQ
jgi:hypothetical protein